MLDDIIENFTHAKNIYSYVKTMKISTIDVLKNICLFCDFFGQNERKMTKLKMLKKVKELVKVSTNLANT